MYNYPKIIILSAAALILLVVTMFYNSVINKEVYRRGTVENMSTYNSPPPPPPPPPPPMNNNCSPPVRIQIADGQLLGPGAYSTVDHDCQSCNRIGNVCSAYTKQQAALQVAAPPPPKMNNNCSPPVPILIAGGQLLGPGAYATVDHDCQTCNRNGNNCSSLTKSQQASADAAAAAALAQRQAFERQQAAEAAARQAAEAAARQAADALARQQAEARQQEAQRQAVITNKRNNINSENDYVPYFIQTVSGSNQKLLLGSSIKAGANNIVSFTINFTGVKNSDQRTNNWNQIFGLSTDRNGGDQRYLAAWICPGSNTLHIRTETEANSNDNITDCNYGLSVGIHRIDIIGMTNGDLSQTYWVYDNGKLFANPTISSKRVDAFVTPVYLYSSYNGYRHVSELGHSVSSFVLVTGNREMNPQTVINGINAFNDQLKYIQSM